MSNYVTINNSTFEFNAFLANDTDKGSIFPLSKSAIEYLEVEDNLAFPGLRGTITIANFFGIMQKFEIFDIGNSLNILSIDISNKDAEATGALPVRLSFESIIGEAGENSANMVDKKITCNFEEFQVGYLRNRYIENKDLGDGTCSDYIKKVVLTGLGESEVEEVFKVEEDTKDILNTGVPAPAGSIVKQTQSCYEVLRFLLRYAYFEDGIPSLLQVQNVYENKTVKRKFKFINLGKFISGFYNKISRREDDLSGYLLETFITGDASSASTFGANFIDKYDILRPNLKDLLARKWVDYNIAPQSCSVDGLVSSEFFTYENAKNLFETEVLGNTYIPNLPDRSVENNSAPNTAVETDSGFYGSENTVSLNAITTVVPEISEWKDGIKAMVLKSFIYDNTAITFRVQGNLYREPGYFIRVKVEQNQEDKKKTQDMSGYYFVISIKHIFSGVNYQNEIVAVKLNKNERSTKSLSSGLISNLISGLTSPSTTASNTVNVSDTSETTSSTFSIPSPPSTVTPGIINLSEVQESETIPGMVEVRLTESQIREELLQEELGNN